MLLLPTLLILFTLSVAAIPLGSRANGQTPHIQGLPDLPLPDLSDAAGILGALPIPSLAKKPSIRRRFIMGADYATSSGPFLSKSSHKRQGPVSESQGSTTPLPFPANNLPQHIPLISTPGSPPT